MSDHTTRHDWEIGEVLTLLDAPLGDLVFEAQSVHCRRHRANEVQISTLLSIKTGGCPEDCKYRPQSVHDDTGLDAHALLPVDDVVAAAKEAREAGATRFCMGAAWRSPTNSQTRKVGAQALCFMADAGSIFCGDQLLTTPNPAFDEDMAMCGDLGITATAAEEPADKMHAA